MTRKEIIAAYLEAEIAVLEARIESISQNTSMRLEAKCCRKQVELLRDKLLQIQTA